MDLDVDAWLYGLIHRGTPGDVAYYARACDGARSVLELGCGDARVLATLVDNGLEAWGLELDSDRARRARERLVLSEPPRTATIRTGDMRDFELGRTFDRVLIPYSGLWALGGERGIRKCLRCVRRHLAPRGTLHLDVWNVARREVPRALERDLAPRPLTRIDLPGGRVDVFESDVWDPEAQRIDATYRFVIAEGAKRTVRTRTLSHDYLFADQLLALLGAEGFVVVSRHGGFGGERFRAHSAVLALTCGTAPPPS